MGRMFTQYEDDGQDIGFMVRLDNILYFLAGDVLYRETVDSSKGWTIKDICDVWNLRIMPGDERTLKATLIADGYIEVVDPVHPEIIHITNKGLAFIDEKGYTGLAIEKHDERKKREYNEAIEQAVHLSTLRANSWNLWISVISLIISVSALIISLFK